MDLIGLNGVGFDWIGLDSICDALPPSLAELPLHSPQVRFGCSNLVSVGYLAS